MKSGVWTGRLILIMLSGMFGITGISPSTIYHDAPHGQVVEEAGQTI